MNKYNMNSIYFLETVKKKNGEPSNRKKPILNKSQNPTTISISEAIKRIDNIERLPKNLVESVEAIIELRDNSVHFINEKTMVKEIQELGFACIKNYMSIIKRWELEINLQDYNFYLMPLAYVDSKIYAESITTSETKNYLDFVKSKLKTKDENDEDFDIAISIEINLKKANSFDALGVSYDQNGVKITMSEEDIKQKYPYTHAKVIENCKLRYENFKADSRFNTLMKQIKLNPKLHYMRKLDPDNKKSQVKPFYNTNIWQFLDGHYNKCAKSMN